jgi:hypothetical protein
LKPVLESIIFKINICECLCFKYSIDYQDIYDPAYNDALLYYKMALVDLDKMIFTLEEEKKNGYISEDALDKGVSHISQQLFELSFLVEETHKNLMEYGSELNAFLNRASF